MEKLSEHFSREEVERSEYAIRHEIDNKIPDIQLDFWKEGCKKLEVIRSKWIEKYPDRAKYGVIISSGYRCPEVNTGIGGSVNSSHRGFTYLDNEYFKCYAFDIDFDSINPNWNKEFFDLVIKNSELMSFIDQIIYEFGHWIHIGGIIFRNPRHEILNYLGNGKYENYKDSI